jgi:hypothetical protein
MACKRKSDVSFFALSCSAHRWGPSPFIPSGDTIAANFTPFPIFTWLAALARTLLGRTGLA